MDVLIRPLELQDIDYVCEMEEQAFSMPWHRESFVEMINNENAIYLVAEDDCGVVCGCIGLLCIAGEGDICNVVVHKDYRRRGIGRALVEGILKDGEANELTAFTLEVRVSNTPAIKLYESFGFVNEGIRPGFYDKPKEDALIMWRRI